MSLAPIIAGLSEAARNLSPSFSPGFAPPADMSAIQGAEKKLALSFPGDLVDFLLIANGQREPGMEPNPVLPCLRFMDGEDITCTTSAAWLNGVSDIVGITECLRSEYDELAECANDFAIYGPAKYHRNVIGFTTTENSDCLVIDLSPTTGGEVGQITMVRTQPFVIAVIAPSLASLLQSVLNGYQTGRFHYDNGWASWIESDPASQ